eukprot:5136365-Amphidinium_carterae.1
MVKIGRHYYIHGLIIEGHATSITINRQKVKEHICQSDWYDVSHQHQGRHNHQGPAPMEIDQINGVKGKRKGKGKGKSKGTLKGPPIKGKGKNNKG